MSFEFLKNEQRIDFIKKYPQLRIMGNKYRLLDWIGQTLTELDFNTALDGFSGSGCVGYLLKCMGKRVNSNDFLNFSYHIANALIANSDSLINNDELKKIIAFNNKRKHFVTNKFKNIFYNKEDLNFFDNTWANLQTILNPFKRSLIIAALCRASLKKQPRGVFTTITAGNGKYDDGRSDLRKSIQSHFIESIALFNSLIFDTGHNHQATCEDIFEINPSRYDLVYFDPPYVPRSDDNCYTKRYHFLEGLSCYWTGVEILEESVVKKLKKKYTPFSYRKESNQSFRKLFHRFRDSIIILSYSSNGYPDRKELEQLLIEAKGNDNVEVVSMQHTYNFGSHDKVSNERKHVEEYLLIGA
ncbi:MAG: DNA adenine methylase [Desulfobacterales bacterium]|nr:DNA adenine methylase [Desulfobacterales bacterium]